MAGDLQPLSDNFAIVDADGHPTIYFIQWAQERQIDITAAVTADQALAIVTAYIAAHTLHEGSGIQITPSGNLADNPTIAADAQEILDQISSTRGSILYRGALGWAARVPGTASYILTSAGAGADPIWAAPAAGSVAWGAITGTLSAQTDLQTALDTKSTLTGTPAAGNLTKFSGAGSITNGDLSGDVTTSGSLAVTIGANKVTNAMLAQMASGTIKGRIAGGLGNAQDLSGTQVTTLIDIFTSALKGAVPLSGGGTVNFLRADATWAPPPGGGVLPVVDGSIPPVFLQNPDGSLIYTPI